MKALYQVETKDYRRYFVMARDFNEAERKVHEKLVDDDTSSILTPHGDLDLNYKEPQVYSVMKLDDMFIP